MKTPEQKKLAVAVAKDVLKMLNPRAKTKYIPTHGTYLNLNDIGLYQKYSGKSKNQIAQDVLKKGLAKNCRACAVGGLFIAHVMRKDGLKIGEFLAHKSLFVYKDYKDIDGDR